MIVSKPKPNALVALGIFILINFSIGFYMLNPILEKSGSWYHYLIVTITFLLGAILLIRQLMSYKVVSIGDNTLRAKYPFRGKLIEREVKELVSWKEEVIKTKSAPFRQLEISFNNFLLKLTIQENTGYEQILNYLKKKAGKREIK